MLSNHVHRLAVVDTEDNNRVKGIITQTAVARFLAHVAELPMKTFMAADQAVVTCPASGTLLDALDSMMSNKRHGLPVVDGDGRIVANVSATDIRYLGSVSHDAVHAAVSKNVMDYLREERRHASLVPITVRAGDAYATALMFLVNTGLHRLYIVDDDNRPIGVFTLSDALRVVAPPSLKAAPSSGIAAPASVQSK